MVFIHGESFEWNSGNPYDGSVLAAYGNVIVVTLNFRLGILGFLKTGLDSTSKANFGLIDQVAALLWVKDNIEAFGGDPDAVTLFGHGTGAACIGFLMLSPMIVKEGDKLLFRRAILMSGSALSDWALAGKPMDVTFQVAQWLNCPTNEDMAACLRKKRLQEIMSADAYSPTFTTTFGPVVDGLVIPNDPKHLMTSYSHLFSKFELIYGVTEVESAHLLGPVALTHGMLEKERDQELKKYLNVRCEFKPESCLARTLAEYTPSDFKTDDGMIGFTSHEPDRASVARNMLLDMLSDARSAAPIALTARLHAVVNPQSYFYVFGHTTSSKDYIRNKTVHGEELPYVFGVPLSGPKFHFQDHYDGMEKLFSEVVMTLWCNFAHTGNPNVPGSYTYLSLNPSYRTFFDVDWPEFDELNEQYLYLGIPLKVMQHYRKSEMLYWNEIFPKFSINGTLDPIHNFRPQYPKRPTSKSMPAWLQSLPTGRVSAPERNWKFPPKSTSPTYGFEVLEPQYPRSEDRVNEEERYGTVITGEPETKNGTTMNVLIIIGALFLLANLGLFGILYYKCIRLKKRNALDKSPYEDPTEATEIASEKHQKVEEQPLANGCNIIRMMNSKSTKSEDTYEAVKTHESCSSKHKLTRQMSSSTIDAHTKVRDWIANEIVHRCSPRFLRRPRRQASTDSKQRKGERLEEVTEGKTDHTRPNSKITGSNSTLGQSPTRPVSPTEGVKEAAKPSFIPVQKSHKKAEKVSVAVDATPAGRGSSVMRQQPIELTKSLDYNMFEDDKGVPLRRSVTLEDCSAAKPSSRKSSTSSISLKYQAITEPTIIKIEHNHSKSDPVEMTLSTTKKLKTFEPLDINVTSRDDLDQVPPLSPEESLQTIKRRNFPKVLPDYPGESKQTLAHKRRSMPAPGHLFLPIPENPSLSQPNSPTGKSFSRLPPAPPPRISSTLGRNNSNPTVQSPAVIAAEPPFPEEPEVACNNLYIGPLIPSRENRKVIVKPADTYKYNNQPIYDNLNPKTENVGGNMLLRTVVTTDPANPIRKNEPKYIIRPTISRTISDPAKNKGPRVVLNDNLVGQVDPKLQRADSGKMDDAAKGESSDVEQNLSALSRQNSKQKCSQIPTFVKASNTSLNKESSSESTPSEESDTGTVVKKV